MSEWPKYRIIGGEGRYDVQVAWGNEGWLSKRPRWLSLLTRVGCEYFDTVADAEKWCRDHKKRVALRDTVVKVIE